MEGRSRHDVWRDVHRGVTRRVFKCIAVRMIEACWRIAKSSSCEWPVT